MRVFVFLLVFLSGCASTVDGVVDRAGEKNLLLPAEWRPLEKVVEVGERVLTRGLTTCLVPNLLVADLAEWERNYPEGSIDRRALLLHEKTHATRQADAGLGPWVARYVADPDFRWREERKGWREEIRALVKAGVRVPIDAYAASMAQDYVLLGRPMVSYEDAREWLEFAVKESAEGR